MEDRCIVCGEVVTEGRQICPKCEEKGCGMTREDVNDTISALRLAITVKAKHGLNVNEFRIGYDLAQAIAATSNFLCNKGAEGTFYTMFGIPVVIDYKRPMSLEIAVVEKIRVWQTYKGGSEDGRETDVRKDDN